MKVSRYIPQIAVDNIINKKRRSLLSIVAIALSVAIIFVSLTLFNVIQKYSKKDEADQNFHYFLQVKDDDYDSFYYTMDKEVVYGYYGEYQNDFFSIHGIDETAMFLDFEGRLPTNINEILLPSTYQVEIGESITLSYQEASIEQGNYFLEEAFDLDTSIMTSHNYTVVGVYHYQETINALNQGVMVLYTAETPNYQRAYFYVSDQQVHKDDSLQRVMEIFNVSKQDIFINEEGIASASLMAYLQDTTTLLAMFIFIIIIAILMSVVSVYNVLIVNDQDRRKEIGLLKSIGTTAFELKVLLIMELALLGIIGSIIGIALGSGIGYAILKVVFASFNMGINFLFLFNPLNMLCSSILGMLLMIVSGYLLYRKYFYSNAIADLKGNVVQYDVPYNPNRFTVTSVTWRMFVIYNERIKKQTKNLRRSFFFIILTITMFCGIALSNMMFRINYNDIEHDLLLKETTMSLMVTNPYYELSESLYQLYEEDKAIYQIYTLQRRIVGINGYLPYDFIIEQKNDDTIKSNKAVKNGVEYSKIVNRCYLLDTYQINILMQEGNVVYGSKDMLSENGLILIVNGDAIDRSKITTENANVLIGGVMGTINTTASFTIDAVVFLDTTTSPQLSFDGDYIIGFNSRTLGDGMKMHENSYMETTLKVVLFASADSDKVEEEIGHIITNYSLNRNFELINYVSIREDGAIATFMIGILLYPLLLMLMIIGAININNVLKGNMYIKRNDFSIMKSVGITTIQLRGIMIFEYIENFINAGLETMLLCIPIILLEKKVTIASVFKLSDNYVAMFVISFCILSPIIIALLALNSFRELNKITPIENTYDIK